MALGLSCPGRAKPRAYTRSHDRAARGCHRAAGLEPPVLGPTGRPFELFPDPKPLRRATDPARIIALCNQKGGVGKTTTTINLGATLAEYGRRVLAIDFDPQGALSAGLGVPHPRRPDDLRPAARHAEATPPRRSCTPASPNLDIIPANIDLSRRRGAPGQRGRPRADPGPRAPQGADDYDVVLIDCQPSLGLLTVNALTAATAC